MDEVGSDCDSSRLYNYFYDGGTPAEKSDESRGKARRAVAAKLVPNVSAGPVSEASSLGVGGLIGTENDVPNKTLARNKETAKGVPGDPGVRA